MKPPHVIYAVLATLVIFAAGVVTGGLVVRHGLPEKTAPPQGSGWQMARLEQFQRAVNQLDLTPDQRMKVLRIARERQEYIADLMGILEPDLPGDFARMRREIEQVLTPEQRRQLEQRWAQVQRKRFGNRLGEMKPGDGQLLQPGPLRPPEDRRPMAPDGQSQSFRPNAPRPSRPLPERRPSFEKPEPASPQPAPR